MIRKAKLCFQNFMGNLIHGEFLQIILNVTEYACRVKSCNRTKYICQEVKNFRVCKETIFSTLYFVSNFFKFTVFAAS